jgi:hypothetical protein
MENSLASLVDLSSAQLDESIKGTLSSLSLSLSLLAGLEHLLVIYGLFLSSLFDRVWTN